MENNPNLIIPYLEDFLKLLQKDVHNAVKRNIVRALQFIEIPDEFLGLAADNCFQLLTSNKELTLVIEDQLSYASPGFKSRAKKILKQLKQY